MLHRDVETRQQRLGDVACGLALCGLVTGTAFAGPFSTNVTTDVYGVAQGGVVNGIPTANDNNDGNPDINDAINLMQGSALARNVDADPLFVDPDEVWAELNGTIFLIGLTAGFSNTVGIYTDLGVGAVQTPVLGPFSGFGFAGDGTPAGCWSRPPGREEAPETSSNWPEAPGLRPGRTGPVATVSVRFADNRTVDYHTFTLRLIYGNDAERVDEAHDIPCPG